MPTTKNPSPRIQLKRIGEPWKTGDGRRVLVDRLWPRGFSKQAARIDVWLKEIAPSTALRQWFGHQPAKWAECQRRYGEELDGNTEGLSHLRELLAAGPITLVYAARAPENNAVALANYLNGRSVRIARRAAGRTGAA